MKKNENVKEVLKSAEVKVEVKEKKQRKPRKSFPDQIIKRIDARAKNVDRVKYFEIREKLVSALIDLEKLVEEEKAKTKQEKIIFKRLAKFTEADIRSYLSQINEVK